jgi:modulator of FtsH protease HflK
VQINQSNNNGGGPWGSGGGNGGGGGPWGKGGGGGGRKDPPDMDKLMREAKDKFKNMIPKQSKSFFLLIAVILIGGYLATGFYKIQPDEQGVVLRFGEWVRTNYDPGLKYHLPYPIETVIKPRVTIENRTEVGFRSTAGGRQTIASERRMITGDENFVDLTFSVLWRIKDAGEFLFNIRNPDITIKEASESVMREVVGSTTIQRALTEGRGEIEAEVRQELQTLLDQYKSGVEIRRVALQSVDPPEPVIESFTEVQRARTDKERLRNEADKYRNDIIPRARGEAEQILQDALGYKEAVVSKAKGEADKFRAVHTAYKASKDITEQRMYIETMEQVLKSSTKVILSEDGKGNGVVPYLPLPELKKRSVAAAKGDSYEN